MKDLVGRLVVRLVVGSLLVAVSGCWSTNFTRTDRAFVPHRGSHPPDLYLDRRPLRPYHSVGIIEVKGPASDFDLDEVVDHAVARATKLGCQLLVDRTMHLGAAQRVLYAGAWVPTTSNQTTVNNYNASQPGRREFICGVYDDDGVARPPAVAPVPPPAPAPASPPAPVPPPGPAPGAPPT